MGPTEIRYMCDGPIETFECIWVNIMLDWIRSQNCRNTLLLHTADQLVKSSKKWGALCISNRGSDIDQMDRYQIVKARISVGAGCIIY